MTKKAKHCSKHLTGLNADNYSQYAQDTASACALWADFPSRGSCVADAEDACFSHGSAISKFVEGLESQERFPDSGFPYGCADAAAADGRRGSNVYEVNLWLWSFGRGKPRLGGLSVEKTFERQVAAGEASKERAAENCRRCKADKAWFKVKEVFDSICTE